jgi:hypothetical protein
MNKGLLISGLGHLGLVLWALLGGWFTWTNEPPAIPVANVSLISSSEFDAMTAAAPKADETAATPTLQPEATNTPKPQPKPAAEAPADPTPPPAEPAPTADEAPTPDVVPPEKPPVAPPSDTPQPIPVQPSDQAPAPSAAERIASTPVDSTDQINKADVAAPEQSDTPSPDSEPVPEEPPASPEKTVTAVTPDAKPADDNAPQLAPTTSPRPVARPKATQTPPAETKTADAQPAEPATDPATTDTSAADQAAIDAALADATAPASETATPAPSQTGSGGTGDQPIGAALNSGEVDNLRHVIGPLWNIGSLSTEASRVTVTMRVQITQDQNILSVEMVDFTGGTAEAAQQAFEAAKRAVYRGAKVGLGLPADKYDTWKSMLFTFDSSQGRLR